MKSNRTRIFLMLTLAATSSLFSQIVSSPPVPRSSPSLKYITARIHEKLRPVGQETHIWVLSPLQWFRFKKNGSITELQFLLISERDWYPIGIDINMIDRIEYELSAQPEACVLPTSTPAPKPDKVPITAAGTWRGTYRNSLGDTGPTTLVITSSTNGIYGTLDGDQFKNAIWNGQTLKWSYVSPSNGVTYHCEFRLTGQNSGQFNYTAVGSTTYTGSVENYVRQ